MTSTSMDRAAAVTDVLIAAVGSVVLVACTLRRTVASIVGGLGVLGPVAAAVLGALRFSGVDRSVPAHVVAVHLAATVGMPMLGLSLGLLVARPARPRRIAAVLVALLVVLSFALRGPAWRTVAGAVGMIGAVIAAGFLMRRDRIAGGAGVAGAVLVVFAGLVVGGPGELWGVSRTAWFHVVFAVAIASIGFALVRGSASRAPES